MWSWVIYCQTYQNAIICSHLKRRFQQKHEGCFIAYCVWRVLCSWSQWTVFGLSMDNWLFDIYFVSCSEWLICQCVIFLYDIFQWSECVCGMISVVKHTEERRITSTHPTSHWANSVEPTVLHSSYRFTLFNFSMSLQDVSAIENSVINLTSIELNVGTFSSLIL